MRAGQGGVVAEPLLPGPFRCAASGLCAVNIGRTKAMVRPRRMTEHVHIPGIDDVSKRKSSRKLKLLKQDRNLSSDFCVEKP